MGEIVITMECDGNRENVLAELQARQELGETLAGGKIVGVMIPAGKDSLSESLDELECMLAERDHD